MTRDDVITAAFRVWGREFYKTTSLTMVAESLGVSKSALYRHFLGKETLLEAMGDRFYDDYAAALKPAIAEALKEPRRQEQTVVMVRFISSYFARRFDYFVYSLMRLHGRKEQHFFNTEALARRGASFEGLDRTETNCQYPSLLFLAGITALFGTALFHKHRRGFRSPVYTAEEIAAVREAAAAVPPPSDEEVRIFAGSVASLVLRGLAFDRALIDSLPYKTLEAQDAPPHTPPDPLLKAVAEAVAEEGPWSASMETVAKRSGLSKSGLYAHFKSKADMLSRLFMSEFERIAGCAAARIAAGKNREEQLYLAILSITGYLRDRPEILTALDWVRIQRLELNLSIPPVLHDFFASLQLANSMESAGYLAQWSMFLIVSALMRRRLSETEDCPGCPGEAPEAGEALDSKSLRKIFRFITLGIEGLESA